MYKIKSDYYNDSENDEMYHDDSYECDPLHSYSGYYNNTQADFGNTNHYSSHHPYSINNNNNSSSSININNGKNDVIASGPNHGLGVFTPPFYVTVEQARDTLWVLLCAIA